MAAARRPARRKSVKRTRKPSSKCSKRFPCAIVSDGKVMEGGFKTYAKYGKAEFVLTKLPRGAKVIPLKGAMTRSRLGRRVSKKSLASMSAAELDRARARATEAMTPKEKADLRKALRGVK